MLPHPYDRLSDVKPWDSGDYVRIGPRQGVPYPYRPEPTVTVATGQPGEYYVQAVSSVSDVALAYIRSIGHEQAFETFREGWEAARERDARS